MAEILLFADRDFGGLHTHLFESTPDLTQLLTVGRHVIADWEPQASWNDITSSFVVVSGEWLFFKDINFRTPYGRGNNAATPGAFGPGIYPWVEDWGIDNDTLSSLQVAEL